MSDAKQPGPETSQTHPVPPPSVEQQIAELNRRLNVMQRSFAELDRITAQLVRHTHDADGRVVVPLASGR